MEEHDSSDHLSSSLTDLMTSLMVIFILLLLAFISHAAKKDAVVADVLLRKLQTDLKIQGIDNNKLKRDPRDPNAILVIVPGDLMNFETQRADLRPEGDQWLDKNIPQFAAALCDPKYAASVDSIVVEGHTDATGWAGHTALQSENENLILSQKRSMAVVQEALHSLESNPSDRTCFLDKLAAVGRGKRDPEVCQLAGGNKCSADTINAASRRVIFRIRVKAADEQKIKKAM